MKNDKLDAENIFAAAEKHLSANPAKLKIVVDLIKECAGITDNDRCEMSIKIFECGHNFAKSHGFSFEDIE